ncbi:LysR family transcriptional regulator [Hyphomonas sp. FCG-A18]|uniref:LysR family transcriptional regulator n=1 Tax=Hyphomonas sp. FCG-A18 TaxID=3080019 RepID=UPI002B2F43B6|nr:LysR family transcriptional regulator [Hyphomonas sp. FCG-A18]
MNWQAISFDWNQVRAFLATAEEGSLSAAARALGQTQPTLSRQVAALEEDLGIVLFERAGRAMALTTAGLELLEHVKVMADAATRVSLSASGQSQAVEGRVVITATDSLATYHLPAILRKVREQAPNIQVEILTSNDVRDLTRREADIAIRHGRPDQADLIAKLVGEISWHLYASEDYLKNCPPIKTLSDIEALDFIGFENNEQLIDELKTAGLNLKLKNFVMSSTTGTVMRELVKAGIGVSFLTRDVEKQEPKIKPLLKDQLSFLVPIWLVTHRELHTSRRIRLVYDILAAELPKIARR